MPSQSRVASRRSCLVLHVWNVLFLLATGAAEFGNGFSICPENEGLCWNLRSTTTKTNTDRLMKNKIVINNN